MSIRFKLLLPLVLVVVAFSSILHLYWLPRFDAEERAQQVASEQSVLILLTASLVEPLLAGDLSTVHEVLDRALRERPGWKGLRLVDMTGRTLYPLEAGDDATAQGLTLFSHTLTASDRPVAMLELAADIDSRIREEIRAIRHLEWLLIGLLAVVMMISAWIQDVWVRLPLARLANAAQRIAAGQFKVSLPQASPDETGQLVAAFAQMRDAVLERERSLHAARDRAEALAQAKSEFLANTSHEIRSPMNGVLGMLELLGKSELSAAQRQYVDSAYRSGEHLMTVLNDILDLSKVEAGRMRLEAVDFHLLQLLQDLIDLFGGPARQKHIHLTWELGGDVPHWLRGDKTRLWQVLSNLMGNAIKFTEQGEVRVAVYRENGPYRFEVQDTGVGIEAPALGRIFDPFEQADSSTTRRYGGTGLGLALCRQLIELMGGEIDVQSTPGRGSRFWFTLPLEEAQAPEQRPPSEPPGPDAPPQSQEGESPGQRAEAEAMPRARVLVVEDNPVNQAVVRGMLEGIVGQVDLAENGACALERVASTRYDLVLMDVQMPVLDGYEATARIRKQEGDARHTPIIALTANVMAGDADRCLAAGMDDYIAKPVQLAVLRNKVLRWLPVWRPSAGDGAMGQDLDEEQLRHLRDNLGSAFNGVLRTYVQDGLRRVSAMEQALAADDGPWLVREAHTLRGCSQSLGIRRVAELCQALEHSARARGALGQDEQVSALRETVNDAVATLQREWLQSGNTCGDPAAIQD